MAISPSIWRSATRLARRVIRFSPMRALSSALVSFGLAASFVLAPACDKPRSHVALDMGRLGTDLTARENEVMAGPKVTAAMNDLFTSLGSEPQLLAAGTKLFSRVEADPKIAMAGQTVIGQLTSSPIVQKVVMEIMAANPGASPDQIGEKVGARFQNITSSPAVQPAFQAAFGDLMASLHPQARFKTVLDQTTAKLDAYLSQPERVAHWSDRLRELNGGADPDPTKATQLYLDHAWSKDRVEAYLLKLFANPTFRKELASTFADLLDQPALQAELLTVASNVAGDKAEQQAAVDLMLLLVQEPIDSAQLSTKLHAALTAPVLTGGLDKVIKIVFEDPKIAAAVSVHFDKLMADPGIRKDFDDLIDHW